MNRTDHRSAQAHLIEATQHLATAGVLTRDGSGSTELTIEQRARLTEAVATARYLLDRIEGSLRGRSMDDQLADLLASAGSEGSERAAPRSTVRGAETPSDDRHLER